MTPLTAFPLPLSPSRVTAVAVRLDAGYRSDLPSTGLQFGETPDSQNFVMLNGGLEPRPMLSQRGTNPNPLGGVMQGGREIISSAGTAYPFISSATRFAWHSLGSWSALSYVSSYGVSTPPANAATDYWDITQIYADQPDEMIAVAAPSSYQQLYCWKSGATVFSILTGSPKAKYVAPFNNYLMAFNLYDGGAGLNLPQRVQWSDRGSVSSWTGGLSGFQDLLDMRGSGTRIMAEESRMVLFSDYEIWQGTASDPVFIFRFDPIDRTLGCPYPWTACQTPLGIMFLARNYQVYLLPKGGGISQPIGEPIHRALREAINQPQRAWAEYDQNTSTYQLHYVAGGATYPSRALWLNLDTGKWAPQAYDPVGGALEISRGFEAAVTSAATTWNDLYSAGITWDQLNMTWDQLLGTSTARAMTVGSSAGTMYYQNSNVTSDDGTAVPCYWESGGLWPELPERQKTVMSVAIDYRAGSASSLTISVGADHSAFQSVSGMMLPVVSSVSQAKSDVYLNARYPVVRLDVEGARPRLYRAQVTARIQGR